MMVEDQTRQTLKRSLYLCLYEMPQKLKPEEQLTQGAT